MSITPNLPPVIKPRYFDHSSGAPLAGGQLFTYQAGTTTPQTTYTDATGNTANTNPIVLDSNGEFNLWLDPSLSYKFVLEDSLGNVQWTVDQVVGILIPGSVATVSIAAGAVTSAKIAAGAIVSSNIASGGVGRSNLATGAVAKRTINPQTSAYAITDSDDIVTCNAASGAFTVTLPAASLEQGRLFNIIKTDSTGNVVTIDPTGSDSISGATSQSLISQGDSIVVISDGSNWYVQ